MKTWKWLFFILLGINIAVIAGLALFLGGSYESPEGEDSYTGNESGIEIKMDNNAVETLIMEAMEDDSIDVSISEAGIDLSSDQSVYGMDITASFDLLPVSTGDTVVFEVADIDISGLPLSQDMLYSLVRTQSELPEGLAFSSEERALVIDTAFFGEAVGYDVEVDSIDYENDEWYFSMKR